ncbi:MAG: helix-turn-helix transcriptional regulator [Methyloligellaceae bacterium]
MSFYWKRQVQEMVLYSDQHLGRLERAGKFPKRVKIGDNRTGYVKVEVDDWIKDRIERREKTDRHS